MFVCVGLSLVVTCVSTGVQEEPIYVCFACEDCFSESSLEEHFDSLKHLIHTLVSFDLFMWFVFIIVSAVQLCVDASRTTNLCEGLQMTSVCTHVFHKSTDRI